jgi:hypothetical protein
MSSPMMSSPPGLRSRERGVVLIAVLLALAVMSLMVAAASALTRSGIAAESLEQRRLASRLALRSGLESAKALIAATPPEERIFLDGTPVRLDLGGGLAAEASIRDAAGLADLNRSDPALLEAVLAGPLSPAQARSLAAAIAGLRARAAEQAPQTPPPPQQPAATGTPAPAAPPAPVLFHATAQIMDLIPAGAATPEAAAAALASRLTVFNPTGLLNPLATPDAILRAIPGLTPADRTAIEAARTARNPQALQPLLDRLKTSLAITTPTVFLITIRLEKSPAIIPNTTASATVLSTQKDKIPFHTLAVSGL